MVIWRIFVTIFIVGIFVNVHEVEAFNLTAYIRVRATTNEAMQTTTLPSPVGVMRPIGMMGINGRRPRRRYRYRGRWL